MLYSFYFLGFVLKQLTISACMESFKSCFYLKMTRLAVLLNTSCSIILKDSKSNPFSQGKRYSQKSSNEDKIHMVAFRSK